MSELIKGFKTKEGVKKIDYLSLANKPTFDLVASYRKAGSYEWTCPKDGEYIALIVGGGGGGYVGESYHGGELEYYEYLVYEGGKHGDFNICRGDFSAQSKIPLVVGAGGEAGTYVERNGEGTHNGGGFAGGTSSFNGITAEGGISGNWSKVSNSERRIPARVSDKLSGWFGLAIFLDEEGKPVTMLCDGGDAIEPKYPYSGNIGDTNMPSLNKYKLSPSIYHTDHQNPTVTAITPTDCGAGGGALRAYSNYVVDWTLNGAPGADGGVFIYKVR